ncbi:MAG: S8 family serine peptidase [Sphingobacteriaceae bacterium]|nr:S8 family serine peptidase [Sphingobacteriaceae bacterium]
MKRTSILFSVLLAFSLWSGPAVSQLQPASTVLSFQNGQVRIVPQTMEQMQLAWEKLAAFESKKYFLLSFEKLPNQKTFDQLQASGLYFEGYAGKASYFASAKTNYDLRSLQAANVISIAAIPANIKLDPALVKPLEHRPLERNGDRILVSIQAFETVDLGKLNHFIWSTSSFSPTKNRYSEHLVSGYVHPRDLKTLTAHPAIQFVEPAAPFSEPEDREGRSLHRSHSIDNQMQGGRRYDGTGVVMGIADDGAIGPHIDFTGRLTQYTTNFALNNTHGDMVSGIAVGAANLDPTKKGMAPGAYLHLYAISNYPHVVPAVANYANLGTTITSTSYSQGNGGVYTADAATIDDQIRNNTMLMHVFSAGNAGTANHNYGAGAGWGNITGGYKAAKNVMAVANLRNTDSLENSSSRGPAQDGRIKPDIAANGFNQLSTGPNNTYLVGGGTSAASPGIAGIFAQLSHAYRANNNDSVPPSAFLKAAMLNTAQDLGNPGPDFRFGWGRINALRAVQTIENNRFFTGNISTGDSAVHALQVPANVKELRIMVYWADKAGVANTTKALVNNLDLRVHAPGGSVVLPWVLNPTPTVAALNSPAVRGVDTLNNAEQVTITDPTEGNYSIRVHGTAVPFGPQRYWIVYEWYTEEITVAYPMGGEGFVPGETELIRWDAVGVPGTFTVQFTTNNGGTWTNIATNLANNVRHVSWTVPNTITGRARIRVVAGSISSESAQNFTIIPLVSNIIYSFICPTELGLSWNPVTNAEGYIIYRLGQRYMDSIGVTATTNFTVTGITPSDTTWFAVAPIGANGIKGRRSLAVIKPLNTTFGCQAAPAANFVASSTATCPNQEIILTDQSLNGATSWRWSITPSSFTYMNGTNDSSQSPVVAFTANGAYTVQLIASNQYGADTSIRSNYISVGNGMAIPVTETFATASLPANWRIENPDNAATWQFRTGVGASGASNTGMAWINFFSYNAAGQIDALVSPVIDLTGGVVAPYLYFDVSYAQFSATLFDGLRIEVSNDCGQTYQPSSYFKEGLNLATVGTLTSTFTPNLASQWRRDSVDLTPYLGSRIRIKFVGICGYGNNLYLSNIAVNTSSGMSVGFALNGDYCVNTDLTFTNSSAGNINSYSWDFGVGATPATANTAGPHLVRYASTGLKTASLTITGPAGSSNASQTFNISSPANAGFSFSATGATVNFSTTSTNATSYFWNFGDGSTSTDANPTHNYASSNVYQVEHVAINGCENDTISQTVIAFATAVQSLAEFKAVLFPNPGKGIFELRLNGLDATAPSTLEVRDLQGRLVYNESIAAGLSAIDHRFALDFLAAGMYVVNWSNAGRHLHLPLVVSLR